MTEDELTFRHKDVDLHNRRKLSGGGEEAKNNLITSRQET